MSNPPAIAVRGLQGLALAIILPLLAVRPALAQAAGQNSLFSAAPATGLLAPGSTVRGDVFGQGGALAPQAEWPPSAPHATAPIAVPMVPAGQVALALSARFGKGAPLIDGGLTWRVYSARPDATGKYQLVKEDKSSAPTMVLPAGAYVVHVGFGLATAVKPVTLSGQAVHEDFVRSPRRRPRTSRSPKSPPIAPKASGCTTTRWCPLPPIRSRTPSA